MSTTVSTATRWRVSRARPAGVTFTRVLRAEWIKLWSVRANVLMLVGAAAGAIALGVLIAGVGGGTERAIPADSVSLSLAGMDLAIIAIGALGVSLVAGEYATKLVYVSFAAVPTRWPVLAAKSLVFGGAAGVLMAVAAVVAFLGGQAVFDGPTASLTEPEVWRVVLGQAAYCVAAGLMGISLAFVLRSTAASIGILLAGLLVVPGLMSFFPDSISEWIIPYLPSSAADAFATIDPSGDLLSAQAGALVLGAWVVGLLLAAAASLRWRDA